MSIQKIPTTAAKTAALLTLCMGAHLQAGVEEEIGLKQEGAKPKLSDLSFCHPEDNMFDLSELIDHPLGFIPLIVPITEPAIGYGAVGALIFISENGDSSDGKPRKANITAVGGLATQNGSEGYFGAHMGNWMDGNLETMIMVADMSLNLDFYGSGSNGLQYSIDARILNLNARYRIGSSNSLVGLGYIYGEMNTRFKWGPPTYAQDDDDPSESRLGGVRLQYRYEDLDNFYTPNKGFRGEAEVTFHDPSFGATETYQKAEASAYYYHPINENLHLGVRGTVEMSFGDTPFYQLPFIGLRGVPAMRYQGERIAFTELELRWRVHNRVSLVGFTGAGVTSSDYFGEDWRDSVFTGGVGIRYEIAKEQGLHMGLDVGFSEETTALYIVFGSAWLGF